MKIKRAKKSQLSTTESKKKRLSKQPEQEQNHRYGDHLEGYQMGGGGSIIGERCRDEEV